MMFYINGQDIERLTLGLFNRKEEGGVSIVNLSTVEASSESFLAACLNYLHEQGVNRGSLEGIALADGAGSATALRTVYTLANAWNFTSPIALFAVKKERNLSDEEALTRAEFEPSLFLRPYYENAPQITPTKKDTLGRK